MPTPMKRLMLYIIMVCASCTRTGVAAPEMTVTGTENRGNYECRSVEFDVGNDERIKGYLLVPDRAADEKCPAIILLHDHGARFDIGKEKLVRPPCAPEHIARSSREWTGKYFDGAYFGDSLAALGYVVFVTDALYWGERSSEKAQEWSRLNFGKPSDREVIKRLKNEVFEEQQAVYGYCMAEYGMEWAEKILKDDIASVNLVASLPFVDKRRIGAFGFSMGAHRCWLLAAHSRKVRCGAAVCWMTVLEDYDADSPSDLSMRISRLRSEMDFPEIGKLLSHKNMLFISGADDPLFPATSVEKAYVKLHGSYGKKGVLRTEFMEGGHHCGTKVQEAVIQFFDNNL